MATTQVKSSEFKAKMAAHLRQVKKGHELVLLDRDTPIAKVIPLQNNKEKLKIIPPQEKTGLKNIKIPKLKKKPTIDVVKMLQEDRQDKIESTLL